MDSRTADTNDATTLIIAQELYDSTNIQIQKELITCNLYNDIFICPAGWGDANSDFNFSLLASNILFPYFDDSSYYRMCGINFGFCFGTK